MRYVLIPLLAAAALSGCKSNQPAPYKGEGRLVAEGPAREVLTAPGGAIGYLADPFLAKEKGVNASDMTYVGTAKVVRASGGAPTVLGEGVATLPGAFFFSPDGRSAGALVRWSFPMQRGTLVVADVEKGSTRTVSSDVTFFGFSPERGLVGYVSERKLKLEPVDGSREAVVVAEGVGTFDFAPKGGAIAVRQRAMTGGALLLVDTGAATPAVRTVGEHVADYAWSPDGRRLAFTARSEKGGNDLFVIGVDEAKPRKVGENVPQFRFSPDGRHLAFRGDTSLKKQFGDFFLLAEGAPKAAKVGENVTEFAFDPTSRRLAWLDGYSAQSRGGSLTWTDVAAEPKPAKVAANVPSFIWSHRGDELAFIGRIVSPHFSIDLNLYRIGKDEKPLKVGRGVFGYSFTRDDARLLFRTECTRNARACDLHAVRVDAPLDPAKLLATGIYTYELDPKDESYVMLTYARTDADALDLAAVPADGSVGPRTLDRMVVPGTKFVGDSIAYAVLEQKRLGLYVADEPTFAAEPAPEGD